MTDPRKAFLIDLVRLSALMRVAVFNENRFTDIELSRQSGLSVARVNQVLVMALTSDYRDDQLELLVSQMNSLLYLTVPACFSGDPIEIPAPVTVMFPPMPVLIALTGMEAYVFESLTKMGQGGRIEYRIRKTFQTRVKKWLVDNFLNAESAIKGIAQATADQQIVVAQDLPPGSSFPKPPAHGEGLTDKFVADAISKRFNVHPDDVKIIGNL